MSQQSMMRTTSMIGVEKAGGRFAGWEYPD